MPILKSTREILDNPWDECLQNAIIPQNVPPQCYELLTFDEIEVWEQIYFDGGNIGIYGAWKPYAEFYIITYNLFMKIPAGIEIYQGVDAGSKIWKKASELGIVLPINRIWSLSKSNDSYLENLI
jgi:hypothetical protein